MTQQPPTLAELLQHSPGRWPVLETALANGILSVDGHVKEISPSGAAQLLPAAAELMISQTDPVSIGVACALLHRLAEASGIAELPPELAANWEQIEKKSWRLHGTAYRASWEALCWWYRRSPLVLSVGYRIPTEWICWEQPFTFPEAEERIREQAIDFPSGRRRENPWELERLDELRAIALEGDRLHEYSVTRVSFIEPGTSGWALIREGRVVGTVGLINWNTAGT